MIKVPRVTLLFTYATLLFNLLIIMELRSYSQLSLADISISRCYKLFTNIFVFEALDSSAIVTLLFRWVDQFCLL